MYIAFQFLSLYKEILKCLISSLSLMKNYVQSTVKVSKTKEIYNFIA